MIRIIKYPIYTGLFFGSLLSFSQDSKVVNLGDMAVSPGTEVVFPDQVHNQGTGIIINDGITYFRDAFTNDGNFFYNKEGKIIFDGEKVQKIDGSVDIRSKDVLFNNPTSNIAFELENKLNISGTANFTDGIVKVDPVKGNFSLEKDAKAENTSNQSHVDGFVDKTGKKDFSFPIGNKGYYRYAKISTLHKDTDKFSSRYHYANSSDNGMPHDKDKLPGDIVLIDNAEYWTVERKEGAPENIMLTLEWDEQTTPKEFYDIDLKNALTIVRWDGSKWEDQAGTASIDDDYRTVTAPVKSFGVFALARKDAISLDLDVFNAVIIKNTDDHFVIGKLDNYDTNRVEIYNRWGVKVFETENYGKNDNVFKGYSKGRVTLKQGEKLPAGTYYYIITCEYKDNKNQEKNFKKAGYLHLEND